MGIKIQINSLEALNRLIGGDTELELELRKSTAIQLLKYKVEPLLNDPQVISALNEVTKELQREVNKKITEDIADWRNGKWTIKEEIMKAHREQVASLIEEKKKEFEKLGKAIIDQQVNEALDAWFKANDLQAKIRREIEWKIGGTIGLHTQRAVEQVKKTEYVPSARIERLELE